MPPEVPEKPGKRWFGWFRRRPRKPRPPEIVGIDLVYTFNGASVDKDGNITGNYRLDTKKSSVRIR